MLIIFLHLFIELFHKDFNSLVGGQSDVGVIHRAGHRLPAVLRRLHVTTNTSDIEM